MRSTLRTRVLERHPGGHVDVAWCLSARNYGSYRVDISKEKGIAPQEMAVVAELSVLRHLTSSDKSPIQHEYTAGTLLFSVSKGAIKRLLKKQSTMSEAYRYAGFLRTRFRGTAIEVKKDFDFWDANELDHDESNRKELVITDDFRNPYYSVRIPGMGVIDITEHAIERYDELHQTEPNTSVKSPYQSMLRRLKNPELSRYEIPSYAQSNKTVKYNGTDREEYWRHPSAGEVFIIIRNTLTGAKTLVTVATPGAKRLGQQVKVGEKCDYADSPTSQPLSRVSGDSKRAER